MTPKRAQQEAKVPNAMRLPHGCRSFALSPIVPCQLTLDRIEGQKKPSTWAFCLWAARVSNRARRIKSAPGPS
jgi:hypothetical protein